MIRKTTAVTVNDIADICGVSRGTVDRALNNRGGISKKTKELILKTAKEKGFIKNQNAAALSMGRSKLIGMIVFTLNSEFFATVVTSVQNEASKHGYSVLVMISGYDPEKELECAERLTSMNVCGLIVCSVLNDGSLYKSLKDRGVPVITVMNRIDNLDFIGIDDYGAMYGSTKLVIGKGYKKLCYVSPVLSKSKNENIYAQAERYRGFLSAVKDCFTGVTEIIDDYGKYEAMFELIKNESSCAVICSSDSYTVDCIARLRNTSVGIMGFDRISVLEKLYPALAGVSFSVSDVGSEAVNFLLKDNSGENSVINKLLPFSLIDGESITDKTDK